MRVVQYSNRHLIVEAEYRGGLRSLRQQASSPRNAGLDGKVTIHHHQLTPCSLVARAFLGATKTVPAQRAHERTGDNANVAMAQTIQMLHRLLGGGGIVDVCARNTQAGTVLTAV